MTKQTKRKIGRPMFEPTAEQRRMVAAFTAYGASTTDIAAVIGISAPTLRRHFWRELELGAVQANAKVAESIYRKALGNGAGAVTAAIFWLKARANWIDNPTPSGKKEQAALAARSAGGEETGWGADLQFEGDALN